MILGIAGPAGAGKDTVADYLIERHGFVKLKFGGPLRQMLDAVGLFEPADREARERNFDGFDFSWRQAAQALGTEWGRALDQDIWVKLVGRQVEAERWAGCNVVISDVRFENEGALIRSMGGSVIHLHGRRMDLGAAAAHASETGVQYWPSKDHLISNAGSRVELHEQVEMMLQAAQT